MIEFDLNGHHYRGYNSGYFFMDGMPCTEIAFLAALTEERMANTIS